jgi:uncharacterized membrane protein
LVKRIGAFLKATTLGGLFVLLPAVVILAIAAKAVLAVRAVAQSLMQMIAGPGSVAVQFPVLCAVLIVVAVSFVFGLTMISRRGLAAGSWFERALRFRMPGYVAVRALVGGLVNEDREGVVRPVMLTLGDGRESVALVTEDHGNGLLTVFVPGSPNAASGSVQVVRSDLVRPLNARITDIGAALHQRGVGTAQMLAKSQAVAAAGPSEGS